MLIEDHTEVLTADPGRALQPKAPGWPAGEAHVRIKVTNNGTHGSVVSIADDAAGGPGRLIPRPVRQRVITPQTIEALHRLALIAEGRHRHNRLTQETPTAATGAASAWPRSG